MKVRDSVVLIGLCIIAALDAPGFASAKNLLDIACQSAPALYCPHTHCSAPLITSLGNAVEPKSGRRFFLDYPCDLKPGEKVTLVLDLHGGGLTANWQRRYFPISEFKEKYRLVIATPSGKGGSWSTADDEYLRNIVDEIEATIGKANIKAFWLVGHSAGGQAANRLIDEDPFFRERLTGWVSLSGGRLGNKRDEMRAPIPAGSGGLGGGQRPAAPSGATLVSADASVLPPYPFSFIYETGERELTSAGLPPNSRWADKLKCGPQTREPDIVDTRAGYADDIRPHPQSVPSPVWGLQARPGIARLYLYPNCESGRIVADIVRREKGHTEGLEPHVAEQIVKLMIAAGGGSKRRGDHHAVEPAVGARSSAGGPNGLGSS